MSQSIRSNFLHLSALDSEPGSELQFETHQSNRVPRMFLVSFRVSFLNLAQSSFVHVSDPVGVICKLGFELPFASMFNEIGMDC